MRPVLSLVLVLLVFALPVYSQPAKSGSGPLKVGFICGGPIADLGWNYSHNQGRLYLESKLPNQVKTTVVENVPETGEVERVLEKMIAQGYGLFFLTTYGYFEPTLRVANRHPDVIFMQLGRNESTKNLGTYYDLLHEPLYVAGTVAGRMTKTNKLGFVGGHPVPPVLQSINAFTIGARSVNPKAVTKVIWTNSWNDPPSEAEATKGLAETGVDVVTYATSNQSAILKTAESSGIKAVGVFADARQFAQKGWLTGACLEWGPFYVKVVQSVLNHTWKAETQKCGIKEGCYKLCEFGPAVPVDVSKQAKALEQDLKSQKIVIFQGPLKDRDGKVRLAAGQKADMKWLANMDFLVEGVQGSLTKK
jgi:basic membrane protein A and related proteins